MLKLIQELTNDPPPPTTVDGETVPRQVSLSPRELQIVRHILLDEKDRTIAARLNISVHTVHTHLKRIYVKLGVTSRVELILGVLRMYVACARLNGWMHGREEEFSPRRAAA